MRGESLLTPRLMRRRRALLEMGTLGAVGLSLPALLRARETMSHDGEDLGRAVRAGQAVHPGVSQWRPLAH